jgi:hypothetical protein
VACGSFAPDGAETGWQRTQPTSISHKQARIDDATQRVTLSTLMSVFALISVIFLDALIQEIGVA